MELPRNQNGFSISFRFAQCVLVTFVNNNNNNSNGATEKSHFLVKLLTLHHRNRRRLENLLRQRHRCYTTWSLESWLFVIVILVSIANPPLPCFLTPPPFVTPFILVQLDRSIDRSIGHQLSIVHTIVWWRSVGCFITSSMLSISSFFSTI